MTALVAVEYFGRPTCQCPLHSIQNKVHFQCLVQFPADDIAGIPVDDGGEIHPVILKSDICNINTPHLIGTGDGQTFQQIGIDTVLQIGACSGWALDRWPVCPFPAYAAGSAYG